MTHEHSVRAVIARNHWARLLFDEKAISVDQRNHSLVGGEPELYLAAGRCMRTKVRAVGEKIREWWVAADPQKYANWRMIRLLGNQ